MPTSPRQGCALALVLVLAGCAPEAAPRLDPDGVPRVEANDNRAPAGTMHDDTLTLRLVVEDARWYPEAEDGPSADVAAFAEEGRAPMIPGPLIRVPTGAVIDVTIRNALKDSTLSIQGLVTRPAEFGDSVLIEPGASHRFVFEAGEPGTYVYVARQGVVDFDNVEREQLAGAFVVDPPGGSPPDRILVMNIWGEDAIRSQPDGTADTVGYRNALAINGRSFPYTERMQATVGEETRWRVINATTRPHPMHLHGFFYDEVSHGDWMADTAYAPQQVRRVVTEDMRPYQTMTMVFTPDRDGHWLFHCHIGFHMSPETARLVVPEEAPGEETHAHALSGDVGRHMAGLVMGVEVHYPPGMNAPPRSEARRLRLFVQEAKARGSADRAMGYVLQHDDAEPASDSVEIPGSALILTRGEPTDIVVVNRLSEPTGLHWHGLELESFSDGVAGWSGDTGRLAPAIMPGDTFVARLTLARAGTFIYHTHLNDLVQLTDGLYGPLIVLEPGETWDPATDHVYTASWDSPDDDPIHVLVNGAFEPPPPVRLEADVRHRFRFINMGPALVLTYSLRKDGEPVTWQAWAKDGADLPEVQRTFGRAAIRLDVGETADAVVTPAPGDYELVVEHRSGAPRAFVQRLVIR
ncbi:MAG: multicopper oxidase domain-containing protein [Gemmatimonadota bacterium]|jgi:FtsP/CotA-like multicopper oxidase with cupredoxin domain